MALNPITKKNLGSSRTGRVGKALGKKFIPLLKEVIEEEDKKAGRKEALGQNSRSPNLGGDNALKVFEVT